MDLLVIRHAIATDRTPGMTDADDEARPLTRRGRRRFRRAVDGLARLAPAIEVVLHSPWRRAVETAELLDVEQLRATAHLAGPPRAELFAELAGLAGQRIAVVGHQPWLGELIALLTVGEARLGPAFELKKGAAAWLVGSPVPGQMRLTAMLPPRTLRLLA
jgi:phosphohistidine phosphatase